MRARLRLEAPPVGTIALGQARLERIERVGEGKQPVDLVRGCSRVRGGA